MDFLAGRDFGQRGAEISKPYPAIVNESFANHFFPHQDPLGKRFGTGVDMVVQPEFQVVGVVSNLKYRSLREPMGPGFYSPISLLPQFNAPLFLYVRTRTSPRLAIGPVREIVHALAPSLPIFGVETLSQEVKASLWRERLMAVLSSAFGLLAALLAGIGLYGVVAYSTTQRTREIGVRIALGAQGGEVLSMVVAQGLKLALIGIAIGMAAALGLARLLASMLYEVTPSDPTTLVVTSLILTGVTLLACYIPARRATKVEPMAALRYE